MKRLYLLTLFSVLLSAFIFSLKKRKPATIAAGEGLVIKKEWLAVNKTPVTPQKDIRPADQTFLTYPEWFLVFSPEEQAHYFATHTASSFPFMRHVSQIWQGYKIVNNQIRGNFPVNRGYHFMIWVIGTSASVEYSIKALYETLIGRLTDTHQVLTEEDKFNATFTQEYTDFIKDRPWYEFDFKTRLKYLWSAVPLKGPHLLRKIERRYILTSELLVKWVYGKLIGLGTKTVYDEALPTTAVLLERPVNGEASPLVYLSRYDKFNAAAVAIAKSGGNFKEIAGNNSAILLTILVPVAGKNDFYGAQPVFTQPVAADPSMQRVALAIPVPQLSALLLQLDAAHIKIEHIFDY